MGTDVRIANTTSRYVGVARASARRRSVATLMLAVSLGAACAPAPGPLPPTTPQPAPKTTAPKSPTTTTPRAPTTTVAPGPAACDPVGSNSIAADAGPRSDGPPTSTTATPAGLSADEAYTRSFEASDESRADQVASGAAAPLPVAITSVDQSGRPRIRQVAEADFNSTTAAAVEVVEQSLLAGEAVLDVEPDRAVSITADAEPAPDPNRWQQWALDRLPFEAASRSVTGEEDVLVAVVDTGIAVEHPDLVCSVAASSDFTGEGIASPGSHGTHVAGIIAANSGNGVGIHGAAPGVRLLNAKVLDSTGNGNTSDVANGVLWSVESGAKVINMSLASASPSTAMSTALNYAESHGVVVVAAAGNDGVAQKRDNLALYSWPAADPLTIAVASLDESGEISAFSSNAPYVDVAAPGGLIISTTLKGTYMYKSGTSMATPYASALVALLIAARPNMTPAQVRTHVASNAIDVAPAGFDEASGWGEINLASLTAPLG